MEKRIIPPGLASLKICLGYKECDIRMEKMGKGEPYINIDRDNINISLREYEGIRNPEQDKCPIESELLYWDDSLEEPMECKKCGGSSNTGVVLSVPYSSIQKFFCESCHDILINAMDYEYTKFMKSVQCWSSPGVYLMKNDEIGISLPDTTIFGNRVQEDESYIIASTKISRPNIVFGLDNFSTFQKHLHENEYPQEERECSICQDEKDSMGVILLHEYFGDQYICRNCADEVSESLQELEEEYSELITSSII